MYGRGGAGSASGQFWSRYYAESQERIALRAPKKPAKTHTCRSCQAEYTRQRRVRDALCADCSAVAYRDYMRGYMRQRNASRRERIAASMRGATMPHHEGSAD